jgi:uroporphyrinogen-III synthase
VAQKFYYFFGEICERACNLRSGILPSIFPVMIHCVVVWTSGKSVEIYSTRLESQNKKKSAIGAQTIST